MSVAAIHIAADKGDFATLQRLVKEDASRVHLQNTTGWTPLIYCAYKGWCEIAAHLLDHGAHIDHESLKGRTALYSACARGHSDVVLMLLERGADVTRAREDGFTPLGVSCVRGHVDVVAMLLSYGGTDTDATTDSGKTPLWMAATHGHVEVVEMLLIAGADPFSTPRTHAHTHAHEHTRAETDVFGEDAKGDAKEGSLMDATVERGQLGCARLLQEWHRRYTLWRTRSIRDVCVLLSKPAHTHTHTRVCSCQAHACAQPLGVHHTPTHAHAHTHACALLTQTCDIHARAHVCVADKGTHADAHEDTHIDTHVCLSGAHMCVTDTSCTHVCACELYAALKRRGDRGCVLPTVDTRVCVCAHTPVSAHHDIRARNTDTHTHTDTRVCASAGSTHVCATDARASSAHVRDGGHDTRVCDGESLCSTHTDTDTRVCASEGHSVSHTHTHPHTHTSVCGGVSVYGSVAASTESHISTDTRVCALGGGVRVSEGQSASVCVCGAKHESHSCTYTRVCSTHTDTERAHTTEGQPMGEPAISSGNIREKTVFQQRGFIGGNDSVCVCRGKRKIECVSGAATDAHAHARVCEGVCACVHTSVLSYVLMETDRELFGEFMGLLGRMDVYM